MTVEELLKSLEDSPIERLRWRVLAKFGTLPSERAARRLSDREVLICGLHMVLDARGNDAEVETDRNERFDEALFFDLRG